jgi:glycosyltransferase involved in cell wall biosynthesis
MPKISAVLITFNEEADIARALRSVSWCDEIVVVDSGSTDRTVAICKEHGCRVLHREFSGYGEQKAFAVQQATNDWVFVVDADEEVSPGLQDEILRGLDHTDGHGFYVPIATVLWDHVVRTDERHVKAKLRVFDRRYGYIRNELVHESVSLQGQTAHLHNLMYNYSYANITDYFDKFNRYTSAAARQCFSKGKRAGVLTAIARMPAKFLQFYLIHGYFRDGSIGLVWSFFSSLYPAVKNLKVLELQQSAAPRRAQEETFVRPALLPQHSTHAGRWAAFGRGRTASLIRRFYGTAGERSSVSSSAWSYVLAALLVGVALVFMVLFRQHDRADYSVLLLGSVAASVWFWGVRPALVATALALLGIDYFSIPPQNSFTLPDMDGVVQLAVFAALSLLITLMIYKSRRRFFR